MAEESDTTGKAEVTTTGTEAAKPTPKTRSGQAKKTVGAVRTRVGQLVWTLCALAALVLAAGALLISLQGVGSNADNQLFQWIVDAGDKLDLGVLSRQNGLFDFTGKHGDTKDALANWGLAAVVWLVVGRVLDRVIRP